MDQQKYQKHKKEEANFRKMQLQYGTLAERAIYRVNKSFKVHVRTVDSSPIVYVFLGRFSPAALLLLSHSLL